MSFPSSHRERFRSVDKQNVGMLKSAPGRGWISACYFTVTTYSCKAVDFKYCTCFISTL